MTTITQYDYTKVYIQLMMIQKLAAHSKLKENKQIALKTHSK